MAVDRVDLAVGRGEIVGIVGESGAGKSTIGNAVMGLLDRPGRVTAGEIVFDGVRVDPADDHAMQALRGKRIGMIFQDPLTSLNPLFTVGQQLVETIRVHRGPGRGPRPGPGPSSCFASVGIAEPQERIDQYPHQFSGGMRQRVVIALVLCTDPDLIIADEPTTALDVSVQAQILGLIRDLVRQRGIGVILVTHDMGVIAETTDRVVVMFRGRVVETGPTADVIHRPQHAYTQKPHPAPSRAATASFIAFRGSRIPRARQQAARAPSTSPATGWDRARPRRRPARPAVRWWSCRDVRLDFLSHGAILRRNRRYFQAVRGVSFDIAEREVVGLVGESGCGKSSIARMLVQIHRPTAGSIRFDGMPLGTAASRAEDMAIRRQIQIIFQDPYSSLNPRMRVERIVAEPIRHHRLAGSDAETRAIVSDLLDIVGLGAGAADKFPHEFSGGQRQRIAIARALATRPRFLICDEPTSGARRVHPGADPEPAQGPARTPSTSRCSFISHDLPVVRQMWRPDHRHAVGARSSRKPRRRPCFRPRKVPMPGNC